MRPGRPHWVRWPSVLRAGSEGPLGFGADYNPEQWPREVWDDDVRLMRQAGVNIVSLGIFSWARLQPAEDSWDFAWLDEVMDLLHAHGIAVDLATATASPPPWLSARHPEILPVTRTGETMWPGARQHWRPTSPVFRQHALAVVEAMAGRYADHPALAAWHVSNELGCHNLYDYSDDAAAAFRAWLSERYGDLDVLNHAWGTAFWSQRYSDWSQVLPPRLTPTIPNPTHQLDFKRFSSDALKDYLRAEREVLDRLTPEVPVTTNFMVMSNFTGLDYADWAAEVDFVSNDHYTVVGDRALDELSFSANLTSGLAGGQPWFLMEHSTSAVNWRAINPPKADGALVRDSLTHVAHGADAVCFFQWRQSVAGAEKYHSAMVPHGGEDTEIYRTVVRLGRHLERLAPVVGSRRRQARAAILFDIESLWALDLEANPSSSLSHRGEALDWYAAFLALGVRADVLPTVAPLEGYDVVVAPVLHVMPDRRAAGGVRRGRRSPGHDVLLRRRGRERPRVAGRLPGRVAWAARHPRRGVRAAPGRRRGGPRRRQHREPVDRPDHRHGAGHGDLRDLQDWHAGGPPRRDASYCRSGLRHVRLHPSRTGWSRAPRWQAARGRRSGQ